MTRRQSPASIDKLDALAASLRATYKVDVLTVKFDLSAPNASERLFRLVAENGLHVESMILSFAARIMKRTFVSPR
jgi:short-subunit dehydrogenase